MPRHPPKLQDTQRITNIIRNVLEVHNPCVIVVLSREEGSGEIGGVDVGEGVNLGVPAPEAKIETANAGALVIYYDYLSLWRSYGEIRWSFVGEFRR
jgi:hypothetical protein